jgi:hypothetical protein
MLATTPTTVLEAVNLMLSTIGEAPVSTVENSGVLDAVAARQQLSVINREVQTRGWHWNTEENVTITPSHPDGFIILPSNTLRVDASDVDIDAVQRGNRLYDRKNRTYQFSRPVTVDLILLLPFEELPEAARFYITIRAARKFQEGVLGSPELSQFTLRDEIMAKATLEDAEANTADFNILNNISVREVLLR